MISRTLLLLSVLIPISAIGSVALDFEQRLSMDLEKVVKTVDPDGVVLVELKSHTDNIDLPATPFSLPVGPIDLDNVKSAKVTILSKVEPFPESVKSIIKSRLTRYTKDVQIDVSSSWSDLTKDKVAPEEPSEITNFFKQNWSVFLWLLVSAAGLMVFWRMMTQITGPVNDLKNAIETGVGQVTSSLNQANEKEEQFEEVQQSVGSSEESEVSEHFLSELSANALVELVADCYWGEFDSYAAYIWRRLSAEKVQEMISVMPTLASYGRYLVNVKESDLGWHKDPYYLKPVSLHGLSNEDLKAAIGTKLNLIPLVSPGRMKSLQLSAAEKIQLLSVEAGKSDELMSLVKSKKHSDPRSFPSLFRIEIRSVEEESDLMQQPQISMNVKSQAVTWIWSRELADDKIQSILKDYTAQDLASSWVGPEEVLSRLQSLLPAKKWALMSSYMEKSKPSRQTSTFREIHQRIVANLKDVESEKVA